MSSMVIDSLAIMSATIGVSMAPGHTALMRIPLEAYSSAALFVRPITSCLDAWYIARPGRAIRPTMEEQLTMAPLPCSRIWRSSYFMQFQTPRRLIAFTRSNSSPLASVVSTAGDCTPALLYAASRRPKVDTVCSIIAATSPRQRHCSARQSLYGQWRPVLLLQSEPHARRCLLAPPRLPLPRRLWLLPDPCQSLHQSRVRLCSQKASS